MTLETAGAPELANSGNMAFPIPYGKEKRWVEIPEAKLLGFLQPRSVAPLENVSELLKSKLRQPVGASPLASRAVGGRAVVVVDDSTRSVPSAILLDAVMEELLAGGTSPPQVTLLVATGLHRPLTEPEKNQILGRWKGRVSVECHDARNRQRLLEVGTTSLGTRILINRTFMEANLKILTGDVEYHQFCGFGGGAKSVYPGLAGAEAIQSNHSRMDWEGTGCGLLEGNPVRAEIEEVGRMVGVDHLLSVVLNREGRIVSVHAGDVELAFREACRVVDRIYRVTAPGRADLVIVSPGGWPKDLTLYQSQKAIEAALRVVEPGGTVIVSAACTEGSGSRRFERWMEEALNPEEILTRIQGSFEMGGHKAYQIARAVCRAEVYLYSTLCPDRVNSWFLNPLRRWDEVKSFVDKAKRVIVLPQATLTLAEPQI